MILNRNDYQKKVLGCWMGKNIGGTLGAPFEWKRQVNNVSFYTQDLHGEPLPNDDLDIQLLWLIALEEQGIDIDAHTLSEYWCLYVTPHWAEYGTGKINMRSGLLPPLSGTVNNVYKDSCGAFIRSEIWACIAPGCPSLAVRYAYQDAILDHGNGEGTYAEVFCAALESAAFVMSDIRKLIDIGLSYIPQDCGVAKAVHTAIECFDSGKKWRDTRDEILRRHRGSSAWGMPEETSAEDRKKGFDEGRLGYDVPSNIGILILGLLYGGNDFEKMMCTTVNCGEDTDCTAATAGSIFGIIHGIDKIPQKWIQPIGRSIKTVVLDLGDLGNRVAADIDDLSRRTESIAFQVLAADKARLAIVSDKPTDLSDLNEEGMKGVRNGTELTAKMNSTEFRFDFFTVSVNYGVMPIIRNNEPKKISVTICNTYRIQTNVTLHWYLPDGWRVSPAEDGMFACLHGHMGKNVVLDFELQADKIQKALNRAVLELTIEGRPTVMLVPVILLNGNMTAK